MSESKADERLTEELPADAYVTLSILQNKLAGLSRILPISKAAMDVYNLASADEVESQQIAAAIGRDATLAAEVIRLANGAFCNPSTQLITELERAVLQIGQKRIGELALATNALAALTASAALDGPRTGVATEPGGRRGRGDADRSRTSWQNR